MAWHRRSTKGARSFSVRPTEAIQNASCARRRSPRRYPKPFGSILQRRAPTKATALSPRRRHPPRVPGPPPSSARWWLNQLLMAASSALPIVIPPPSSCTLRPPRSSPLRTNRSPVDSLLLPAGPPSPQWALRHPASSRPPSVAAATSDTLPADASFLGRTRPLYPTPPRKSEAQPTPLPRSAWVAHRGRCCDRSQAGPAAGNCSLNSVRLLSQTH